MLSFKVIVVPTDFSDRSLRALAYAIGLAENYGASIKVLYVNEPSLQVSDMAWIGVEGRALKDERLEEARRHMARIVSERIPADLDADAEVRNGEAVEEIIRYADSVDADVIVMATHGRSGISHVLMGSTAEQVIRKASCPVLTLKQPMLVTPRLRPDSGD